MSDYSDYFDREFIEGLPDEPLAALDALLERWKDVRRSKTSETPVVGDYVRLFTFVHSLAQDADVQIYDISEYDLDDANNQQAMEILEKVFLHTAELCESKLVQREVGRADRLTKEFEDIRSKVQLVEFSDAEFGQIQSLTNELRDLIVRATDLDDRHRARILNRLEDFQKELNKKMSNLDRFWVFFGEAGVRLGEFGENVKPFTDRLRELADIVLKAIDFQEALTGDLGKLLPPPGDDKGEDK